MSPWPETSVNWPASSPQPPGEQALGPAWCVLNTVFQISAPFQAPRGANSCLLHWTLRRADVRAGRAVPSGTLVQDFSSLCKPHADKTSRVLATVGREQGTRLPGTPCRPPWRCRSWQGWTCSLSPACRAAVPKAEGVSVSHSLDSEIKASDYLLLFQGLFLSYRLPQDPWIEGKGWPSILHSKHLLLRFFIISKFILLVFVLSCWGSWEGPRQVQGSDEGGQPAWDPPCVEAEESSSSRIQIRGIEAPCGDTPALPAAWRLGSVIRQVLWLPLSWMGLPWWLSW